MSIKVVYAKKNILRRNLFMSLKSWQIEKIIDESTTEPSIFDTFGMKDKKAFKCGPELKH